MEPLEILKKAIEQRKKISFNYNKKGKIDEGERIGDPYAVFIYTSKNARIQSTKVHILQTDGSSDSGKEFPSFRMFNLEELSNVRLLDEIFNPPDERYNPEWDGYKDIIVKV